MTQDADAAVEPVAEPVPSDNQTGVSTADAKINRAANGMVLWVARHWLFLFNLAWGLYVLVPFLAPILMQLGLTTPASAIYGVYSVFCHQLPDHSFFLFGHDHAPLEPVLVQGGMAEGLNLLVMRKFVGNEFLGYKVALCQRDVAIYGSVLLAGLIYGIVRKRRTVRPLSLKVYVLFLIPIAIDGLSQMVGLRESDWVLRTITGMIFGIGSVWLAYPYVEDAMESVIETETIRLDQVAASKN
jgi:uncharacterized membrane protein